MSKFSHESFDRQRDAPRKAAEQRRVNDWIARLERESRPAPTPAAQVKRATTKRGRDVSTDDSEQQQSDAEIEDEDVSVLELAKRGNAAVASTAATPSVAKRARFASKTALAADLTDRQVVVRASLDIKCKIIQFIFDQGTTARLDDDRFTVQCTCSEDVQTAGDALAHWSTGADIERTCSGSVHRGLKHPMHSVDVRGVLDGRVQYKIVRYSGDTDVDLDASPADAEDNGGDVSMLTAESVRVGWKAFLREWMSDQATKGAKWQEIDLDAWDSYITGAYISCWLRE